LQSNYNDFKILDSVVKFEMTIFRSPIQNLQLTNCTINYLKYHQSSCEYKISITNNVISCNLEDINGNLLEFNNNNVDLKKNVGSLLINDSFFNRVSFNNNVF